MVRPLNNPNVYYVLTNRRPHPPNHCSKPHLRPTVKAKDPFGVRATDVAILLYPVIQLNSDRDDQLEWTVICAAYITGRYKDRIWIYSRLRYFLWKKNAKVTKHQRVTKSHWVIIVLLIQLNHSHKWNIDNYPKPLFRQIFEHPKIINAHLRLDRSRHPSIPSMLEPIVALLIS